MKDKHLSSKFGFPLRVCVEALFFFLAYQNGRRQGGDCRRREEKEEQYMGAQSCHII